MLRLELEDGTAERTLIAVIKSDGKDLGNALLAGFCCRKPLQWQIADKSFFAAILCFVYACIGT